MPQALPFLLLLLLLLLGLRGGSTPAPTPLEADARGLLAELASPQALRGRGVSCRDLHPEALPGFSRLPPRPRALARAALALALSGAACGAEAEATALGLQRELGTPAATTLLRGLARLRDTPSPRALPLLFSLVHLGHPAGPCGPRAGTPPPPQPPPHGVPAPGHRGVRAWPFRCRRAARARRDGEDDACSPPGEREAHRVLEWVPGVSVFYNLGTSIYFAFQGCEVLASERALEMAQDLGYAGLAALTAGAGGPVAMGLGLGLQPGLKAGVRALFGYFMAEGEPPTAPTTYSGPVLIV